MKKSLLAVILGLIVSTAPIAQASPGGIGTTVVEIPVRALLAPAVGFEEKNNIQVALWGELPNQCYTLGTNDVQRQPDGTTILVRQFGVHDSTGVCADESTMPDAMKIGVPFTSVVSAGQFPPGNYQFTYDLDNGQVGSRSLNVQTNITSTVDTLPYAAVSAVTAPDVINGESPVVVHITGILNTTCTTLDPTVQIMYENDVWVLLPTIHTQTGVMCGQIMIPFDRAVNLGTTFPGVHLVQVRSMNGQSQNKVIVVSK